MDNSSNTIPESRVHDIRVLFGQDLDDAPKTKGLSRYFLPVRAEWALASGWVYATVSGPAANAAGGQYDEIMYVLGGMSEAVDDVPDWLAIPHDAIAKAKALIADLKQVTA